MSTLKYDVVSIYVPQKEKTFYFLYNNSYNLFESEGMDFSSMVYMLLFKLRDFGKNHTGYVQLIKEGNHTYQNKSYFDKHELPNLLELCITDEKKLFKNRKKEIDTSLLDENDELKTMNYVSQFNPKRQYHNNYSSVFAGEIALINLLVREMKFEEMLEKMMTLLKKKSQAKNQDRASIEELLGTDNLSFMITGPNGDLWYDLFLRLELPEQEKYNILYQAQPFRILNNKEHVKNLEHVRYALDGAKLDDDSLKKLFEELPKGIQSNPEIAQFYEWHREFY